MFWYPERDCTDNGTCFNNNMRTKLEKILGFYQYLSSPYYPLSNGQVEAVHKSLKTML